jgi:hypothetical protein
MVAVEEGAALVGEGEPPMQVVVVVVLEEEEEEQQQGRFQGWGRRSKSIRRPRGRSWR